jgi:hypothetical protein
MRVSNFIARSKLVAFTKYNDEQIKKDEMAGTCKNAWDVRPGGKKEA